MQISNRPKPIRLSVIIVNFQSKHYLDKCLSSVLSKIKSRVATEIIIVNNDKNEDLSDIGLRFPGIILVNTHRNVGFGAANNLGSQSAGGEYLLFLNPDTQILSDNIGEVLEEFEDKDVGILGSGLVNERKESQEWSAGLDTGIWDLLWNNLGYPRSRLIWKASEKKEVAWVSAAALFIPRRIFAELAGFDENIFMYFEDTDLCQRAKQTGKKIIFFPKFKVSHLCGGSQPFLKDKKRSYYESQDYYFKKHKNKLQYYCLRFLRKILIQQGR